MNDVSLPPQSRKMALYAAGGGFGGAVLAIVIIRIFAGPCYCVHKAPEAQRQQPATVSAVTELESARKRAAA